MNAEIRSVAGAVADALLPTYRLERPLGTGGTATVYLATDVKHGRQVAIKVLRSELLDTDGTERFSDEIRLAARLTHPHIVPLLDSGQAGLAPYYVMPFIEGESLRGRLERAQRLPIGEAIAIASEVADALEYAHAAGIVHRDIKPENILLLRGHALVADFGIARALSQATGDRRTSVGIILGTPMYMSPEQAAGDQDIDGRTDVYALAAVLFEMISGQPPISGANTQALLMRRLTTDAPRLSSLVPDVPASLDEALAAALARDAEARPHSALAFARTIGGASELTGLMTGSGMATTGSMRRTGVQARSLPSVAVLPFANIGADADSEYLSDGITEEIMGTLSRLRTIRVAARASSFAFRSRESDVREIAQKLGVGHVLDGSVRRAGSKVRISVQLVDAASGFEVWSDRLDRGLDDVFAMQDEVAHAVADALSATLVSSTTSSTHGAVAGDAYEAYLRGRYALNKRTERDLREAANAFAQAAERQPHLAVAHAGLAEAQLLLGIYGTSPATTAMSTARAAAQQALAVDPALGVAHAVMGTVCALHDHDWTAAADAFRRALALDPRQPTVSQWHAMHYLLPLGRFDDARAAITHARRLDPLAAALAASEGVVFQFMGALDDAERCLRELITREPGFAIAHFFLGGVLRDRGELAAAEASYREAMATSPASPEMLAGLAHVLARQEQVTEARALLARLRDEEQSRYVSQCLHAQVLLALGDLEGAEVALARAESMRDPALALMGVQPVWHALRGRPAFEAIRRRAGV